jgi:HEAT repeats
MKAILLSPKAWLALLLVAALSGVAYWQREPVLAWYYVRQLTHTYQENRDAYARKVATLEEAALPGVLEGLQSSDAIVCGNMQYALLLMTEQWGVADPRSQRLVECLNIHLADFSPVGQEKIVLLLTAFLQQDGPKPLPPRLTKEVSEILLAAEKNSELRAVSLLLAAELVECVQPGQWVDVCRAMAERGFQDERPGARIAAVQLLLREPMRKNKELVGKAIPLLRDEKSAVRRAALVALASESDLVREEHLLPLLHDDDAEVQWLCEMALRKRGLHDDDLEMARMISHKSPATRMRVLHRLPRMPELNLGEWLRQLSQDPEPAVRTAAARAAADYPQAHFAARLREMAEHDPSETVRWNARFYLRQRSTRAALN